MLQYEVLKHELNEKQAALDELKDALGLERLREEVEMLENKAAEPGFYDNMESAQKILQKTAALKQKDETYLNLVSRCEDTLTLICRRVGRGLVVGGGGWGRTGPRCCSVCTTVGVSVTALRFLRSITLRATKRA